MNDCKAKLKYPIGKVVSMIGAASSVLNNGFYYSYLTDLNKTQEASIEKSPLEEEVEE
jgi:hypothetical protein